MMKERFIYSPKYLYDLGDHVFQIRKYYKVFHRLIDEKIIHPLEFIEPELYDNIIDDIVRVHTKEYLDDLSQLKQTERTIWSELPLDNDIIERFTLVTSGTILAGQKSLEYGYGFNLSGGFHHAFPDHAEGFCYFNDVAIAVRKMLAENKINKIAIVDLDLHQGNGTANTFLGEDNVYTFSMHQENNYPEKELSDYDIGLEDGIDDEHYLSYLHVALDKVFNEFQPEMVFYLAGADPFEDDQLGSLKLTFEGLKERDEMVIEKCFQNNIPIAIVLAGGYARNEDDTVQIHYNTCVTVKELGGKYLD